MLRIIIGLLSLAFFAATVTSKSTVPSSETSSAVCTPIPKNPNCNAKSANTCQISKADLIVKTSSGKIQGSVGTTIMMNTPYKRFCGLRYAQAPIGDLRFKAPLPVQSWNGTLKLNSTYPNSCYRQTNTLGVTLPQSEDCLFLNVFVPGCQKTKLPVFIFVHGGAFTEGASTMYYPDNMIDKGVIFVSLNYRVGPLGFLCLENPNACGNMGLKDQIMAIEWAIANIAAFGGDPERITISGHSAGAASVNLLLLKYLTDSTFLPNANIQNWDIVSGYAECTWARVFSSDHIAMVKSYLASKNIPFTTMDNAIAELRKLNASDFATVFTNSIIVDGAVNINYAPVATDGACKKPLFSEDPLDLIEKFNCSNCDRCKSINILVGSTSMEFVPFLDQSYSWANVSDYNTKWLPNKKTPFPFKIDTEKYNEGRKMIADHYKIAGKLVHDKATLEKRAAECTGMNFGAPMDQMLTTFTSKICFNIYLYIYDGSTSLLNFGSNLLKLGFNHSCHYDDLAHFVPIYLTKSTYQGVQANCSDGGVGEESSNMSGFFCSAHANFAKTGSPGVPGWIPITTKKRNYLWIKDTCTQPAVNPHADDNALFVKFFNKFYN